MISTDEYLMGIGQVTEPVEEVEGFSLGSCHGEVAGMNYDIGFGKVFKSMVTAVGV